ncbi:MAG: DNA polymerase domain-containing protein [Candidatus Thermoplasmatota archaeon]|nr:DNA polymerase domain-containing protein [Candidatus Thermoplasmatota archaeon]
MEGWVLDVAADPMRDLMEVHLLTKDGHVMLSDRYRPCITVSGGGRRLDALSEVLSGIEGVSVHPKRRSLDLDHEGATPCLEVGISSYSKVAEISKEIERIGRYRHFSLYDVDMRLSSRYMLEKDIYPLAHVRVSNGFEVIDDPDWGSSPLPPLTFSRLHVFPKRGSSTPLLSDPIEGIRMDDVHFRDMDEAELIEAMVDGIKEKDPNVILTSGGDSFVLPYLYHRAVMNGIEGSLILDRGLDPYRAPVRNGRSYLSYGTVMFKPHPHMMRGRLHLDLENSFILREGGFIGLAQLSRMSLLPIQEMARMSPGSAISYMECMEALRRGYSIRWKKNRPEEWKTAVDLSLSDRGGHIFDPVVGSFSNVVEMDFSSFYPHIMWRRNISVETINCACCRDNRVPGLKYNICAKRDGLISYVVGDILKKRMEAKRLSRVSRSAVEGDPGPVSSKERYACISGILKWVLVTCFGYTGYKNARFGRIEAHEAITAYAREYLLCAKEIVEGYGFDLLHGIVDSLWMRGSVEMAQAAADEIEKETGIPIEIETIYRWIVFLPNKSNGAGALTKYYGLKENGEVKMRGIESRQHSTPPFIKGLQDECIGALTMAMAAEELPSMRGDVISILNRWGSDLMNNEVDPKDLVITTRVSKELGSYSTRSEHVSALHLMRDAGAEVPPGQKVRYVVLDHDARTHEKRVALMGSETPSHYDVDRYLRLSARAVSNIMHPIGLDERGALEALKGIVQSRL